MIHYESMVCRACKTKIDPSVSEVERNKTAKRIDDCYYRCSSCGVGYSNAQNEATRTKIHPHAEDNVPEEVRDQLHDVLGSAINTRNRTSKVQKFAFETSEDAVTWTVFRYLHETGQLGTLLGESSTQPPTMLLWGCPWPVKKTVETTTGYELLAKLMAVEDRLGEKKIGRSEPDVVLLAADRMTFIEVKYFSPNDWRPHYKNFPRYLSHADGLFTAAPEAVEEAGYYELTRNWVIGCLLARDLGTRFTLVNLALPPCEESAHEFKASVRETQDSTFQFLSWADLIKRLRKPLSGWFEAYLRSRALNGCEEM